MQIGSKPFSSLNPYWRSQSGGRFYKKKKCGAPASRPLPTKNKNCIQEINEHLLVEHLNIPFRYLDMYEFFLWFSTLRD